MNKINNGGPAFPSLRELGDIATTDDGMTLRDYFAAKAVQGMMAGHWNTNYDDWARHAYRLADAMLKAREM